MKSKKPLFIQANVSASAWKLQENEIWNIPTDCNEKRFEMDFIPNAFHQILKSVSGLAITLDGKIFGERRMYAPKESGYQLEGRVSIGGEKYRAFTSSKLFERPDGSLCDVAVLVVCDFGEFPKNFDGMNLAELQQFFADNCDSWRQIKKTLAGYARKKSLAMEFRLKGEIEKALEHEKACDSIYQRLPKKYQW